MNAGYILLSRVYALKTGVWSQGSRLCKLRSDSACNLICRTTRTLSRSHLLALGSRTRCHFRVRYRIYELNATETEHYDASFASEQSAAFPFCSAVAL